MAPAPIPDREQRERQRVGATLRTHRTRRGYDVNQFSQALGISYSYLSNIEAGRKPLTDILLARAADLLEVEQIAIKIPDSENDTQVPA
jgi:transcriptional regulator with XRE-family HTH domain